jgi:hypothetical protein
VNVAFNRIIDAGMPFEQNSTLRYRLSIAIADPVLRFAIRNTASGVDVVRNSVSCREQLLEDANRDSTHIADAALSELRVGGSPA